MAMQEHYSTTMDNLFAASQMMPVDADSLLIAASQTLKRGALVNASGVIVGGGTAAVKASGSLSFTMNPTNAETVTIGSTTLTFTSSTPSEGEVEIGVDVSATIDNLIAALPAEVTGSKDSSDLNITAADGGVAGNDIALATTSTYITPSGAKLSGGADAVLDLDVYAVLAEDVDTTSGAKDAAVYLTGDYNENALIVETSNGATVAACKVNARKVGIFIKPATKY